ncbi:MAG: MmgE/PrpD family protein [Burkholderiales bacterium]
MDNTTRSLANYVAGLQFAELSPSAIHETKRRLIDAIGCGIGGYSNEPASIARQMVAENSGQPPARLLGSGALTSIEMATFANSVMVRYLDCNDTYVSKGSGHPSDMIAASLAMADAFHVDGKNTLLSIAAAYEVYTALADVIALRDLGWDQGVFVVLGCAAGAAKILNLTSEQTANALAIAVTGNIPTRQTRAGELSMWKGCATALAARAGVFSALLAQKGMTGPTAAFEGRHGVWEQVTGPFELGRLGGAGVPFGIERTNLKFFPAEYHSQAPLWIALELRKKVRVDQIEALDVQTYYTAYSEIGSEPEKWHPKTRETADHSLPYLLALGLTDGYINTESFSDERIADTGLRQLMQRIRIAENKEFTREFPSKLVTRIEVITRDGQRIVETAVYPKGHAKNPMSDADLESKFGGLSEGLLAPDQRDALLSALWNVENTADAGKVLAMVQLEGS